MIYISFMSCLYVSHTVYSQRIYKLHARSNAGNPDMPRYWSGKINEAALDITGMFIC